jgi:hypothetical protein
VRTCSTSKAHLLGWWSSWHRTYATVQDLAVLVVCEGIEASGIMLPNIEGRAGLKDVRFWVEG